MRKALAGGAVGFFSGAASLAMARAGLGQTMEIAFAEGSLGSAVSQQILEEEIDWTRVIVDGAFSSVMEGVLWKVRNPGGITEDTGELIINTSGDSPGFGQLSPVSSLNKRQRELLELLSESGDTAILPKNSVSMNDLRQLTNVTGDEFNMFTNGGQRLIIRGLGRKIEVSQEMFNDLVNGYCGKFSGHIHPPGHSMEPGPNDSWFLNKIHQEESSVWGNDGDGWLPFGQTKDYTDEIRSEINREKFRKFYGDQ